MGTYKAEEVNTGYHPKGFKIDKTTIPMNRYTQWEVKPDGKWAFPRPVCFDSMPEEGWVKVEKFNWNNNGPLNEG